MKRLHVVMVTGDFYPDSTGGVQRVVYYLGKGLVEKGHRVTVVTRQVSDAMPLCGEVDGISVVRFAVRAGNVATFHISEMLSSRRAV